MTISYIGKCFKCITTEYLKEYSSNFLPILEERLNRCGMYLNEEPDITFTMKTDVIAVHVCLDIEDTVRPVVLDFDINVLPDHELELSNDIVDMTFEDLEKQKTDRELLESISNRVFKGLRNADVHVQYKDFGAYLDRNRTLTIYVNSLHEVTTGYGVAWTCDLPEGAVDVNAVAQECISTVVDGIQRGDFI